MRMRNAAEENLGFILGLYERSGFSYAWEKTGRRFDGDHVRANIRRAMAADTDTVEIIAERGTDIGCVWYGTRLDHFGNRYGEIEIILIDKDYHGEGRGTRVMKHVIRKFRDMGIYDVRLQVLEANEGARRLYKEMGFVDFARTMRLRISRGQSGAGKK